MMKEIIYSVVVNYGIAGIVAGVGYGVKILKAKIGDKKFNVLVKDCREIVADIKDINHDLGLEEVERKAISKVLAKGKFKDAQLVEDCVKKVISSIDSMVDETTEQQSVPTIQ